MIIPTGQYRLRLPRPDERRDREKRSDRSCPGARGSAHRVLLLALPVLALTLACDRPEAAPGAAEQQAAAGAPATGPAAAGGVVPGTPAGGLAQWIGEIRAGVDSLPALAERDPAAAKNQALLLYVGRQEYVEIYYGTTGRALRDEALAEAVMTAEARFHDLLRTVNTPDGSVDHGALASAATALGRQYDRVLERARTLAVDVDRLVLAEASR